MSYWNKLRGEKVDNEMNYGSDYKFIPATSIESGHGLSIA